MEEGVRRKLQMFKTPHHQRGFLIIEGVLFIYPISSSLSRSDFEGLSYNCNPIYFSRIIIFTMAWKFQVAMTLLLLRSWTHKHDISMIYSYISHGRAETPYNCTKLGIQYDWTVVKLVSRETRQHGWENPMDLNHHVLSYFCFLMGVWFTNMHGTNDLNLDFC